MPCSGVRLEHHRPCASAHSLGCHLPVDKRKRRNPRFAVLGNSWAPAFNALASRNIQDDGLFTVPAVYREILRYGFVRDAEQMPIPMAHWTGNPSVLYDHFSGLLVHSQPPYENVTKYRLHFKIEHARVRAYLVG